MSYAWGRSEVAGTWPRPKYFWFLSLLIMALASGLATGIYHHERRWTPLQRWYLSAYLRSAIATSLSFESGRYELLYAVGRKDLRLAFDEDVRPVTTASGEQSFALTDLSRAVGIQRLQWRTVPYRHDRLHATLQIAVYRDQTLWDAGAPGTVGDADCADCRARCGRPSGRSRHANAATRPPPEGA